MSYHTVVPTDPTYPPPLRRMRPAPWLRVHGRMPTARGVAIVGTRRPTAASVTVAEALATAVARRGFAVWSGGARGIDAVAHRAAIGAGGKTIVVLGAGLDHPSPRSNAALFHEIIESGGAWVSQFDDDITPDTYRFLQRNALLASAVELLILVECPEKSGARNAVMHARKAGTPVAIVPHSPWNLTGAGNNLELRAGAHVITSEHDALGLLARISPEPSFAMLAATEPMSSFALRLLSGLDQPRHADELAIELNAPAAEVLAALVELRLSGHLVTCGDGRVARATPRP